jgi:uncharacterized protein HemY
MFSPKLSPEMARQHFLHQIDRDLQIRLFGWTLLLVWIVAILYMTRTFWLNSQDSLLFPSAKKRRRTRKRRTQTAQSLISSAGGQWI